MTTTKLNTLYFPGKKALPLVYNDIKRWYGNLLYECAHAGYEKRHVDLLTDVKLYYGKYFSDKTRNFFLHHFGDNLVNTINYLFGQDKENIRFLEIGCGCGNQLILAALLGAEAVGCDIRQDVCDLIYKGKNIDLISNLLRTGGRAVIQEYNASNYYNRISRSLDALKPSEVMKILKERNFKIFSLKGGYVLPPFFWRFLPKNLLAPIEQMLCSSLFLSLSYHLMAEKSQKDKYVF